MIRLLGVLLGIGLLAAAAYQQAPRAGSPPRPLASRWDGLLRRARLVDINTAGGAELERLPEVGPALAWRILEYRRQHGGFTRLDELRQVAGIGPATFDALRPYVTVRTHDG